MSALRIWNPVRNTVVVEHARVARGRWERLVGLLGRKSLADGEGLLLQGTRNVHTIGMRFAIDVMYLDPANRVLYTVNALPPNRIALWRWGVHSALELSAGAINRSRTRVGDFVSLVQLDESCGCPAVSLLTS